MTVILSRAGKKTNDRHYNLVQRFTLDIRKSFLTKRGTKLSEISRKAAETLLICCCYKHIRQTAILVHDFYRPPSLNFL